MTIKPKLPPGDLERRDYSAKERDSMDDSDFAGPHESYPIQTQEDLENAARLIGHADDPAAVKAKAKAIAKRKGLTLPQSWQDEEKPDRAAPPDTSLNKDPMKDKVKPKDQAPPETPGLERTAPTPDVSYYAPITRFDAKTREVIGVATAEVKDAHRTVIGYEGSKEAFAKWRGNIREMHDPKKAVGRALEITPDDAGKRIIVRATISKGAEDTWQKVIDGTLTGFSIGGKNGVWTERLIDGEKIPYLERYDQAELSLVDNPSCPEATFEIVRADGMAGEALAPEDEAAIVRVEGTDLERAGATISAATRDGMHQVRDQLHSAHKQAAANCGCDECQDHVEALNKIGLNDDGDGDMDSRAEIAEIVRAEIAKALHAQIAPAIQRINALLAHDAGRSEPADFTRNFTALDTKHDALASQITAIADLVKKIAEQPQGGGPLMHGASQDKRLATQGTQARADDDADIIRRATELGFAPPSDPQQAMYAAARLVRPIPR